MPLLRRILDWTKYERLHHYPVLATFEPSEALKRLQAYEREEWRTCQPWLGLVHGLIGIGLVLWVVLAWFKPTLQALGVFIQIPGWVLTYVLHRRIRRRVQAKVAAELGDGRLWTCIECGYDLRASNDRCPECGASVHVTAQAGNQ